MIKRYIFLFLLLLIARDLPAQTISGRVVDRYTGEGLENTLLTFATTTTTTDSLGHFRFKAEEFPVEVNFFAEGYFSLSIWIWKEEKDLLLELTPFSETLSVVEVESNLIPKRLQQTPAAVGILTRAELQKAGGFSFPIALNAVPGIYVHQGALNTNKLSIRGIGGRSQYSTNRIKAYFEGIPLSSAEGETTLDDLELSLMDRVEVIKGPNSSMYGAGLGGVISIHAGTGGSMGTFGNAEVGFGSFDLLKTSLQVSHKTDTVALFTAYNRLQTDSFRENGAYDRESFSIYGKLGGDNSSSLSFIGNFIRLFAYIPSSLSGKQMEEAPSSAAFAWKQARGYESYDKGMLGVSYKQLLWNELKNTTGLYLSFRDAYEPRPFDILKEDQLAVGARTRFNGEANLFDLVSEFSFGAEFQQEWYDTATFENLYENFSGEGSVRGDHLTDYSQLRRYFTLFAQWNFPLSKTFSVEAGLNLNATSYALTDFYSDDGLDQTGQYDFETILSPRIAGVLELSPMKTLYATVSHGFSTPTVAQTLTPEGLINTGLQPETGMNYELGMKANWLANWLYSEVAVYSIQVRNLLVAERVAEDQYIGRNAGKTAHNGVELLFRSDFPISRRLNIKPFVNASFNFFEFREFVDAGVDYSGNELPGVPEKTINAGLEMISDSGMSIFLHYFHGGEIPLNDANSAYSKSYNLVGLKASYFKTLWRDLELKVYGGVNNIFDESYASSVLPNAVGFGGAAPRYFYPGNPRNYYGGVNLKFLF